MRLTILFLFIALTSHGRQTNFDLKDIKFKGLGFGTTKESIIKSCGQGTRVVTNYECGFFANNQSNGPYYQIAYAGYNYIGSDKEKLFYLENVDFDLNGSVILSYQDKVLTGKTTEEEFVQIFGEKVRDNFVKQHDRKAILLYSKGSDDGGVFTFRNGLLVKFKYWTPC